MKLSTNFIALAIAVSVSPNLLAQGQLEEVIVTAQKRVQSAQNVPIAITALSGDFIENKNILAVKDLQNFTPGLRIAQQDSAKTFIRIRGVGSSKFDVGSSGSVGVFIDEIYLPRFSGADIGLIDLERVEVLKGPQGTLFGRNTAAGAISVWSRRPTQETEAYLEAGVGNEDSYLVRGAWSGAVSDKTSMRFSLGQQQDGGFQKNTLTGTPDDRDNATARLQVQYDASDTLTILASLQYSEREQDAMLQKNIALGTGGPILPLLISPLVSATANDDFREYPVTHDGGFESDSLYSSLRIEKEFETFQLVATTGYLDGDSTIINDFDSNDVNVGLSTFEENYDTFSQEIRLAGENWLGGVYYYMDDAYSDYKFSWLEDSFIDLLHPGVEDNGPIDIETTAWAVFGEYTFDLTEKLSFTLGGRYSVDKIDFTLQGITNAPGIPPTVADFTYSEDKDWDSFDPKIAFTYQLNDDILTYLTYTEGYKAGGIQFTASTEAVAREVFDPEELSAYEFGIKSELLENTLRLNASVFYYDYQDLQVQRVDTSLSGGLPIAFTSNAAESEITGFEFDMNWVPLEGLDIRFAYAYLDTEYNDFIGPGGEDFSGNPLPSSPENTVIGSVDYTATVGGGWMVSVGTDWTWIDEFNFDVTDDDEHTKGGDYTLGAARLAFISPDDHWTIAAFVNNLTDEEYYSQKTRRNSEVLAAAGDGRRYGLRVRYDF